MESGKRAALRAGRSAKVSLGAGLVLVVATGGCGAILGVDFGGGVLDDRDAALETTDANAGVDASGPCIRSQFTAGTFGAGAICGVGACRQTLSGMCPKASVNDAGPATVCGAVFGPELCNGVDDNCNGVVDEGCAGSATTDAGFECTACAYGHHVKKETDGTIVGVMGNYLDDANDTDCVSSSLCQIPGPAWVRNASGPTVTCSKFCTSIGAACQTACSTTQPACDTKAATVNQGNMKFGTYAADFACLQRSVVSGTCVTTATPNTGNCDYQTDRGCGPQATSVFNVFCCCAF